MQTEVIELTELARRPHAPFGEFLIEHRVLDRFQLFRALQLQDRMPRARLGHCAVALGYVVRSQIERLHLEFSARHDHALETMATEAFRRVPEVEVVYERSR
jgi:hypothetical protein